MKSTKEIIEELSELKGSLRADSDQPMKVEEVLSQALSLMIDLAKNLPHAASQKEVNEIFDD